VLTVSLLFAGLPVAVSCLLILLWRKSALFAAVTGVVLAALIMVLWPDFRLAASGWYDALAESTAHTLNVAYVLLGGVLLYQVVRAGDGLSAIAAWVQSRLTDQLHCLLAIVYGVSVFFESATGFGVGILVSAPLLLAMGYSPLVAALISLFGQCAVPWGALAIGTVIGSDMSSISTLHLGVLAVIIGLPFIAMCGAAALWVAGLWRGQVVTALMWLMIYVLVLCVSLLFSSWLAGVELAGCIAGLLVVTFSLLVSRLRGGSHGGLTLPLRALTPFMFLVVCLIISRLFIPVADWLQGMRVGSFQPFYHAGFWLVLAACVALMVLPGSRNNPLQIVTAATGQWYKASLAVACFLLLGHLMKHSGMSIALAQAVAQQAGSHYLAFAPLLGALGGFLTASNASSNALFMDFQMQAAASADISPELMAAAQNTAGSNTTLASPGRVIFAASIVGSPDAESDLLRRVLPVAVAGVLATSLLVTLLVHVVD
jgi:lactate permease